MSLATTLLNAVTVTGPGTALSCAGAGKVIMTVTTSSNFIGEVIFEGSIDAGTSYFPMIGNLPGTKTPVDRLIGAQASGKTIEFEVDGFDFIRPNVKAISAGWVTVVAEATARSVSLSSSYATPGQPAPSTVVPMGATDGTNEQALTMQAAGVPNLRVILYNGAASAGVATISDGQSDLNGLIAVARGQGFNGATWDRMRGNIEGTALASAARTTSGNSADIIAYNGALLAVYLDVTAASGTSPTLDVTVKAKDPASGKYFLIGTFAQKTAVASEAIFIGGGADVEFAVRTYRIEYVIGGTTPSFTFSVGYSVSVK